MSKIKLRLYVAGSSSSCEKVIEEVRQFCEMELTAPYELIIHNVLINPEEAVKAEIIATPTLVKAAPEPSERTFGNLSNPKKLLTELGLESDQSKK